jgi:hypothetical protein
MVITKAQAPIVSTLSEILFKKTNRGRYERIRKPPAVSFTFCEVRYK